MLPYAVMMGTHLSGSSSGAAASTLSLGAALVFAWKRRRAFARRDPPQDPARAVLALGSAVLLYAVSVFLDIRVGIGWFFVAVLGAQIHLFAGFQALRSLAAPLLLLALAAPFPGFARALLTQELVEVIVLVAPPLLEPLIGPTATEGHFLLVPGGELAIVGDCSGLGSLLLVVPLVAILAAAHGLSSAGRIAALAVCGLALVFAGNLARVLISAILVARSSPLAYSESVHELIGTACVLAAIVALFFVSQAMGRPR